MIELNWTVLGNHSLSMGLAYILSLPLAWNRETHTRSAGLRTFPLVSVASCGFMLIAIHVFNDSGAQARVIQGIITGIGFIGGGAILKNSEGASGIATATSIWVTGAIGIAVAWGRHEIAILLCVMTFITLQFGNTAKKAVNDAQKD